MFYSVDGQIVQVGGAFPERRVNTLTFQVAGTQFPDFTVNDINNNRNYFWFDSNVENSVTVNWGDGVVEVFNFSSDGNADFRIGWTGNGQETSRGVTGGALAGRHIYQDGFTGIRNITFEFNSLANILFNDVSQTRLYGTYPEEIGAATSLNKIRLFKSQNLNGLPNSLSNISGVNTIGLSDAFSLKLNTIPDSFFTNSLQNLSVAGSFNLSDTTSSNFFKIDQLYQTLKFFEASNCNIVNIPEELGECTLINDLRISQNDIVNAQSVSRLVNLSLLQITFDDSVTEINIFQDLILLKNLFLRANGYDLQKIKIDWINLKSLTSFIAFQLFISTNQRFNEFIDAFYDLCILQGFLNPSSLEAISTGFPNQFRNVSWGHSSLTQTGTIQAPAGFELGVSNGNLPMTQGEKIYVLKENYGHIITTAQP